MTYYRPMTAGGGAFLVCVGIAIIIGAILPGEMMGPALLAGFATGALAIVIVSIAGRKRGLPKPPNRDIIVVWLCVAAEMIVFIFMAPSLPLDPRTMTLFVLAVVGAHFLPMAWSFGPLIFWLGLACIGVAAIGFFVPAIPLQLISLADGLLKLAFGLVMLAGLARARITARTA